MNVTANDIYMTKTLFVPGRGMVREAYSRGYAYLGDLSEHTYLALFAVKAPVSSWLDYTGGKSDSQGDATWWEPKPRNPDNAGMETPAEHIRNALQVVLGNRYSNGSVTLSPEDFGAVKRRLDAALAILEA